jgi:hypothetical protein
MSRDGPGDVAAQSQFSLFQDFDEGVGTFQVMLYLRFDRCPDHERGRLRAEVPAFEAKKQTVSAPDLRTSLVSALEGISFRAEAAEVPFPAGLGYGPLWAGATRIGVSVKHAGGYRFRVRVEGSLRWIGSWDDVRENEDAGTFTIDCEVPFEGVWIETKDPKRKTALVESFRSVFGNHSFDVESDDFADGFVLRAVPSQ